MQRRLILPLLVVGLSAGFHPASAGEKVHEVGKGLVLKGELSAGARQLLYQVKLEEGKTYQIDMISPDQKALDPFLVLQDAAFKKLAEDDDGGEGLNARIVFRAPATA